MEDPKPQVLPVLPPSARALPRPPWWPGAPAPPRPVSNKLPYFLSLCPLLENVVHHPTLGIYFKNANLTKSQQLV